MRQSLSKQNGMTMISTAIVLGVIAFFVLLILKIGPIYFDHFKVRSSLESLTKDQSLGSKSKREIMKLLRSRFDINSVKHITKDEIKITKKGREVKVAIVYEVIENIAGNLDVLISFDEVIEAGGN